MNINKLKQRIIIIFAIGLSFFLTNYFAPRVFLSGSPDINTEYIAQIRNLPANTLASLRNIANPQDSNDFQQSENARAEFEKLAVKEAPSGLSFAPIAQGVQASEPTEDGKVFYKIEAGTQLEVRSVTLDDGREVKVYIPIK